MATTARSRVSARRLALLLFAALTLLAAAGPSAARAAQTGTPPSSLQVWDLNTHGMDKGTSTNYLKLIDYITDGAQFTYYPDIVVLQEVGTSVLGLTRCAELRDRLAGRTGQGYACSETTYRGGTAVAFRTNRLAVVGSGQSRVEYYRTGPTTCALQTQDNPNDWHSLIIRLRDLFYTGGNQFVNVGSLHFPTDGNDCAWENMKRLDSMMSGLGSAQMSILGGDTNHRDAAITGFGTFSAWECWYQGSSAGTGSCGGQNLGWKDVIYRACLGAASTDAQRWNLCIRPNHWTWEAVPDRRDFIFAKTFSLSNQRTIAWAEAAGYAGGGPQNYSDHRAIGVLANY